MSLSLTLAAVWVVIATVTAMFMSTPAPPCQASPPAPETPSVVGR